MPLGQLQLPRSTASFGAHVVLDEQRFPRSTASFGAHAVLDEQRFPRTFASRGADIGVGLKAGRHGHKPPLYPAKRAHGEEAEARHLEPKQQAQLRMSMLPREQNRSGTQTFRLDLVGVYPILPD